MKHKDVLALLSTLALCEFSAANGHAPDDWVTGMGRVYWNTWLAGKTYVEQNRNAVLTYITDEKRKARGAIH